MILFAIRQLLAIVALPGLVVVFVPIWIARGYGVTFEMPAGAPEGAIVLFGIVTLLAGFVLWAASLYEFATYGRGTLAPWDPPRRLVVRGLYRYVRNPMISGVIFVLFGEALVLRSLPHLVWAVTFLALNFVYIPLFEEPQLEDRFGDDYRRYCLHVSRFVPRLRPWEPDSGR